ncbi:hypothetical protein BCR44DRAFT_1178016 [Catenaria anguillulae PL171]|uniref:Uncharacterized protein n=1 Tax=Catenaria anguillulae PL171 TaxID=765915 RepID=A0A1Y2HKI7_9FUNG|nr:hypothetical protein BCR44DRAFT_1178016 [Catenaria anguillulae PL171]
MAALLFRVLVDNQRNLVLCLDKGIWYPAVTVPVSDWDDQKLDGNTPESFHVLFLNTSGRSYGCVHRLDMVLVTDILRGGRSLIFSNPESAQQPAISDQASSSTAGGTSGKQPLIVRAGRDIEVTLKSVQAAAVERLLSPPPRAVWQKWHAEYKLISSLPESAPFTYHPVANIDIRPMAASCRPNLVHGRAPRALAGSMSTSTRGSPEPEADAERLSGGKLLSSGRRTSSSSRTGSPVVKSGGRGRSKHSSKDPSMAASLKLTTTSPAAIGSPAAPSASVTVLNDYVMATPKPRSPIVLHHAHASPVRAPSRHGAGASTSTSPSVILPSAAVEPQKQMQPSQDSNEMSAIVFDHQASWGPAAEAEVAQAPDSRPISHEPLEPSVAVKPQQEQSLVEEHASDTATELPPLDQKMFGELSQMRCCIDFDSEVAEQEAFSMYMTSLEWLATTGSPHLPLPSPAASTDFETARPTSSQPGTSKSRHKAKRSAKDSSGSSSRKAKKPKLS